MPPPHWCEESLQVSYDRSSRNGGAHHNTLYPSPLPCSFSAWHVNLYVHGDGEIFAGHCIYIMNHSP
ncbi:hypothetical protein QCA50_001975 [Cerrena zonata]|uniref:Uncharacterized protein n=1 Tax=Cerrena zonata TaxID=2478898 RepID=A0AAW0GS85_9APHY